MTASLVLGALGGCGEVLHAPLDELKQPTGMALSPREGYLLVANGDWGQRLDSSSLVAVDLRALERGLRSPLAAGESTSADRPCRRTGDGRVECEPGALIDGDLSLRFGRGAVNIAMDPRANDRARALIPTRIDAGLTWIDVEENNAGALKMSCAEDLDRFCGGEHVRDDVGISPARVRVDEEGYPFAYLPQLLEPGDCLGSEDPDCSGMTLIDLDAPKGPTAVDWVPEFFRDDPFFDTELSGGFAIAQLRCDPDAPAELHRDCRRPLLYASQRHWNGVRMFTVASGVALILSNLHVELSEINVDAANPLPLNGDLAFASPDRLLMVNTTPPALSLIDTSIDEQGELANYVLDSLPLCANPNLLALWTPADASHLAFVSCYSDRRVSVISLDTFTSFRTLNLGEGPNELLIDEGRQRLYVANVLEDSISLVSLDPTSPDYLREFATLGLGTRREPNP